MALTSADIINLRDFIKQSQNDGDDPAKTLDRLGGYLAGMQFAADSREQESKARSERATKAVKVRKPRGQNKNGKLRVGDAEAVEAEA